MARVDGMETEVIRNMLMLHFTLFMTGTALVCLGLAPFWADRPIVWLMRQFNGFLYPHAIRLALSVERDTDEWRFSKLRAEHQKIGNIWISGGVFGVHVDVKLGNDTIEWRPGWLERRIIFDATVGARARTIHERLDAVLPR